MIHEFDLLNLLRQFEVTDFLLGSEFSMFCTKETRAIPWHLCVVAIKTEEINLPWDGTGIGSN